MTFFRDKLKLHLKHFKVTVKVMMILKYTGVVT